MSKWNGKLKCTNDYHGYFSEKLTKGKTYEIKNGRFVFEDGEESLYYENFKDFRRGNPEMSKCLIELPEEDLSYLMKTGRVAEIRNGDKYLIVRDVDSNVYGHQEWVLVSEDGFLIGSDYNSDLTDIGNICECDIMKTYQSYSANNSQLDTDFLDIDSKNYLVWEREEKVKYISGVHFGSSKEYTWILPDNLSEEVKVGSIVKVDTQRGEDLAKVISIFEDKAKGHKSVLEVI